MCVCVWIRKMGEENGIHRFDVKRKGNKTTGQVKEKKTKFKQMIVMLQQNKGRDITYTT